MTAAHAPAELPSAFDFRQRVRFDATAFRDGRPKTILFVVPPGSLAMNFGKLSAAGAELPWLGMAYVAAAARRAGHVVHVRDYEVERLGFDAVAADIRRLQPDLVATAAFINNVDRCLTLCQLVKSIAPRTRTVIGGPQATIFPHELDNATDVDFVLISESEISFCRLAAYSDDPAAYPEIAGVCWRGGDGPLVHNPRQPLIQDMDSIPLPALDLYRMGLYYPPVYIRGRRVANIVTSRGCPYECTFCEAKLTFGRTHRFHSEERVLEDLDFLHRTYGFDSFQFYDDIFTINRKRVVRLCDLLIARGRPYQWMCYTRTDLVDPDLLALMKEAGCYQISFGPESGDQDLLNAIKKKLTVEDNLRGIEATRRAGIVAVGTFMLGLPGESPAQTRKTVDFAIRSKLDYAIFGVTEPYPGTEMWQDCMSTGYFIDADDKHVNHLLPNFSKIWVPNGRTRDELEAAVRHAYRRFYLRPRVLWKWLLNFAHIPVGRSLRYLRAGLVYLVLDPTGTALQRIFAHFPLMRFPERKTEYRGRGYRW
ncbi:MAG: radical SAM protein [Gemmatimonadetes bacterium]|nr:radical SAM protein [Gemmatimonadota bacterium]